MGMLISRHRDRHSEEAPKPRPRRRRKASNPEPTPEATSLDGSDYASLSDEQVLEAYVVTFPEGEATDRDAQVVELRALNTTRDEFNTVPE